ncbi:MAG: hypothetical protein M0P17_09100 [Methanoculleus sp.]|nr:hypothetical protein [Methanoculleus sp.]
MVERFRLLRDVVVDLYLSHQFIADSGNASDTTIDDIFQDIVEHCEPDNDPANLDPANAPQGFGGAAGTSLFSMDSPI